MPRIACSLLITLLLASACRKAEPPPPLEGDWDVTAVITTGYTLAGTQVSRSTFTYPVGNAVNARYLTITSTTMQITYSMGASSDPAVAYSRAGTTLTILGTTPLQTQTIIQLTDKYLTLLSKEITSPTSGTPFEDYRTMEVRYTRR